MPRAINAAGTKILMDFCGMPGTGAPYLIAYQDPGSVWTDGFGHTAGVTQGTTITRAQALAQLDADLAIAENDITSHVTRPLNDNQFSALVSFVFNVGVGAFNASTMLKDLNANNFADVPAQFARWNHIKGVVSAGLTRRRAVEAVLWNTPSASPLPFILPATLPAEIAAVVAPVLANVPALAGSLSLIPGLALLIGTTVTTFLSNLLMTPKTLQ